MAITTISAVKTHLGITTTDEDTALTQWLTQVEAAIKAHVGGPIESEAVTEYYSGNGTNRLCLRNVPVQSITSVYLDDGAYFGTSSSPFAAATQLVAGTDYALEVNQPTGGAIASTTGVLYRLNGLWPRLYGRQGGLLNAIPTNGLGNIKVTYVCGWATVPADIVLAVHQMMATIRQSAENGQPVQSESLDYWSATYLDPSKMAAALTSVQSLLKRYKRWAV